MNIYKNSWFKKIYFISKMKFFDCLRKITSAFFSDENCVCCNDSTYGIPLCKKCLNKLFEMSETVVNRCKKCGKTLISEMEECLECRENNLLVSTDFVYPIFVYRLWMKNLLFEWKLNSKRGMSGVFAKIVWNRLKKSEFGLDSIVVPVPPRPNKLRTKGWDQIDELCKYLKYFYNVNVQSFLVRLNAKEQKKLNREKRLENRGKNYQLSDYAYSLKEKGKLPSEVVLLDDVLTTGSTVEECAGILKKAGIETVKILTIFIVD